MSDDLEMSDATSGPDPDPDPVSLTPGELLNLQADVDEATSNNKVVVIAMYVLPDDCVMGSPSTPATTDSAQTSPTPDGLNGVPPGNKSLVYRFPLVTKAHFTPDDIVPRLSKRFQRASEMQSVIATSNHLYVNAVASFESGSSVRPDDGEEDC